MKELNFNQLEDINGGGWKEAGQAFKGTMKIAWSPVRAIYGGPGAAFRQACSGWKDIKRASKNAYR